MNKIYLRIKQIFIIFKFKFYKLFCKIKKIDNKNVWLISERGIDARDNGYVFYEYLKSNHPEIDARYIISKSSPDYKKITGLGKPIIYGSKEHYILFITAGFLISTHLMGFSPNMGVFNFLNSKKRLNINGKFISLGHGIKNSFHPSLNYKTTKLDILCLAGKKEFDFFKANTDFGNRIKGCGLARYDKLNSDAQNIILIMPTFRMWMTYFSIDDFMKSQYYVKYNQLLNNNKLIELLNNYNYKLIFYPHIEFQKYLSCFRTKSENVILGDISKYDVQELLIKSKLLITDYSSVFFDFAYMNKPVIYYQFDYNEYREKHYKQGYFDHNKDGFGPVLTKENDVIRKIEESFENNFEFKDVYKNRIKDFYINNDNKNCERIFNEISKLKGELSNEK